MEISVLGESIGTSIIADQGIKFEVRYLKLDSQLEQNLFLVRNKAVGQSFDNLFQERELESSF